MNKSLMIVLGVFGFLGLFALGYLGMKAYEQTNQPVTVVPSPVSSPSPSASSSPAAMTDENQDEPIPTPTADVNEVQEVALVAKNFSFTPNEIKAKVGRPLRISIKSSGMPHNFAVDEFQVNSAWILPGKTGVVEFTPDKAGTFEFYCAVANHRQLGMVGQLIVEEWADRLSLEQFFESFPNLNHGQGIELAIFE